MELEQGQIHPNKVLLDSLKIYLTSIGQTDTFNYFTNVYRFLSSEQLKYFAVNNMIVFFDGKTRTFQDLLAYFENTSNMVYFYLNEKRMKEEFYINLIAYIELNYLILLALLKNFNRIYNCSQLLFTPKLDDENNIKDIYSIVDANSYLDNKVFFIYTHISDMLSRVLCKDYLSVLMQVDKGFLNEAGNRMLFLNFEYLFDIILLCLKFILRPNNHLLSEIKIDIESLSKHVKILFSVIMDYILINYKTEDKILKEKFNSIFSLDHYLIFSYMLLNYVMEKKFSEDCGFIYDFGIFFPSFTTFGISFFASLRTKIMNNIADYCSIIDLIDNFDMKKLNDNYYIPPYLIKVNTDSLKNFIVYHMTAWSLSENTYEFVSRNSWIMSFIDICAYSDILEKMIKLVYDLLGREEDVPMIENSLESMFYQNVHNEEIVCNVMNLFYNYFNERCLIVLNKKCVIIRSIFSLNYLITLRHLINYSKIFRNVNWNNLIMIPAFGKMVSVFEELACSAFKSLFFVAHEVLQVMTPNHSLYLRINFDKLRYYDFKNISQMKKENVDINMNTKQSKSKKNKIVFDISSIKDKIPEEFSNNMKPNGIILNESKHLIFPKGYYSPFYLLINSKGIDLSKNNPLPKSLKEIGECWIVKDEVEQLVIHLEEYSQEPENEIFKQNMRYYDYMSEVKFEEDVNNLISFLD
jgi:hypothetical protein